MIRKPAPTRAMAANAIHFFSFENTKPNSKPATALRTMPMEESIPTKAASPMPASATYIDSIM